MPKTPEEIAEEEKSAREAKEKELEDIKKELDDSKKQLNGVQELIKKWGNEMGEHRKAVEEAMKLSKSDDDKSSLKEVLDRIKTIEDTMGVKNKGKETEPKTLDELKKSLSPEQKLKADEVWKKLNPEQKKAIWSDPEAMTKFFKAAAEVPGSIPDSLFATVPGKEEVDPFRKLFGLAKEDGFQPAARRSGANGFMDMDLNNTKGGEQERRLPDGVIPRPKTVQPTK